MEKVCKGALHIPTYVFRYLQIRECERLKKISPMPSRDGCSMIQPRAQSHKQVMKTSCSCSCANQNLVDLFLMVMLWCHLFSPLRKQSSMLYRKDHHRFEATRITI